ncbi:hypothetical protein [Deinococcus pimensis]|uniref:hypothetical protein n=1 Tax=Deinococcus pimensis TaxID=309888 RepID=UPI0004878BFE|nr:hypothetical protein [Deinococcus pimensis]
MTDREDRLDVLMRSEPYWTARAMREQGSAFYQKLGEALERADLANRRRLYGAWLDEFEDFHARGLRLAAEEEA